MKSLNNYGVFDLTPVEDHGGILFKRGCTGTSTPSAIVCCSGLSETACSFDKTAGPITGRMGPTTKKNPRFTTGGLVVSGFTPMVADVLHRIPMHSMHQHNRHIVHHPRIRIRSRNPTYTPKPIVPPLFWSSA